MHTTSGHQSRRAALRPAALYPRANRPGRALTAVMGAAITVIMLLATATGVLAGLGLAHLASTRWQPTDRLTPTVAAAAARVTFTRDSLTTRPHVLPTRARTRHDGLAAGPDDDSNTWSGAGTPISQAHLTRLAETTMPGIVNILSVVSARSAKAGTGIVISSSGDVITNDHVISGARLITATDLGDGRTYTARVLGVDRRHEIAVLHLQLAHGLAVAALRGTRSVRPGNQVVSLGNDGNGNTYVNSGPVLRLRQTIASTTGSHTPLTGLIEAANGIAPGQSGGPMLDSSGHIIGITVAYLRSTATGQPTGIGFAIPSDTAVRIARALLNAPARPRTRQVKAAANPPSQARPARHATIASASSSTL